MSTDYKKIKTFSAACKAQKLNAKELLAKWTANGYPKRIIAEMMLEIFIQAINGEWKADFKKGEDQKHFPLFYYNSQKGFVLHRVDYYYYNTIVSPRLCYQSDEKACHGATYGIKMYNEYMLS